MCAATFNSNSEMGCTCLSPFKNVLQGTALLESSSGGRHNYMLPLQGGQNRDQMI